MPRTGTRPTPGKITGSEQTAAQQTYVDEKSIEPGLNDAWSSVVKFDDKYAPPEQTMTGPIEYTIDSTNAGTFNGRKDKIIGDGDTITFTGFSIETSDLEHTSNVVTTEIGQKYIIVFTRVGSTSEVYLVRAKNGSGQITQLSPPQNLQASAGNARVTLAFTNPNGGNEDDNLIQYKLDSEPTTWTNGSVLASGAITGVQSGLTNDLAYDFRIVARGSGGYSNSDPSNEITQTPAAVWTPADLGTKLLDWYDGTIVDDTTTTGEVDSWIDQKGSIDFANTGTPKADWDEVDTIDWNTSSYLENTDLGDITEFDRDTGEYWATIDYVTGEDNRPFCLSKDNDTDFYLAIRVNSSGIFSFLLGNGPGTSKTWVGTTGYTTGKLIIRVKQDGTALKVYVNDTDVTSENSSANPITTEWESLVTLLNTASMNAFVRSDGTYYGGGSSHGLIRIGNVLTTQEATDLYNYLDNKY